MAKIYNFFLKKKKNLKKNAVYFILTEVEEEIEENILQDLAMTTLAEELRQALSDAKQDVVEDKNTEIDNNKAVFYQTPTTAFDNPQKSLFFDIPIFSFDYHQDITAPAKDLSDQDYRDFFYLLFHQAFYSNFVYEIYESLINETTY